MKKPSSKKKLKAAKKVTGPWMEVLAQMAAEARVDGGVGLQTLLSTAKFSERPRLSMLKHAA